MSRARLACTEKTAITDLTTVLPVRARARPVRPGDQAMVDAARRMPAAHVRPSEEVLVKIGGYVTRPAPPWRQSVKWVQAP